MDQPLSPLDPSPPLETGGRIGAYRLEGCLGRGGMGEVFLGFDERLHRRVAVKRIRHEERATDAQRERFRREARAVARLSHPAIVQIYDLLEDSSGDCLILEYVDGRTLRQILADGPLPVATALSLGRQIAEGLAAAHEAGLIHRDLKVENVIVTPAGQAKVLDFGLARAADAEIDGETLTEHGTVLGTSWAMSPEQASGAEVDERSDLFSFGVLLYEMLGGRSPFRGANALDSLSRVLTASPPPLARIRPGVPPALATLVEELLAKDREHRPRSARSVARLLDEIAKQPSSGSLPPFVAGPPADLSDLPTSEAPVPSLPPRRPGPSPRAALAAAVLAVLAGVLVWLLAGRGAAPPRRIAVASPEVMGDPGDERLALVASGVLESILEGLASREGLAPLDPSQLGGQTGPPAALARTAAADEALTLRIEPAGSFCRVSLRRVDARDDRVLWAKTFDVPAGPRDLRLMADAVRVQLGQAFPDAPLRAGTPELDVRDADYAAFLAIQRRIEAGATPLEPELPRLEAILRTSPHFLQAQRLAAQVALNLFRSTRSPAYVERAGHWTVAAERLAPGDPRPRIDRFHIALAQGRTGEAEAALHELERLAPGDPEALVLRATLAEHRGETAQSLAHLRHAVERVPSWRNLFRLADLEYRNGQVEAARGHLADLLRRAPDNLWGLQKLAEVELMAGDLRRAEAIYLQLVARAPVRSNYTNLGIARFLDGRPDEAVAAYRKALEIAPGHVTVTLNLADAEAARGKTGEARALYTRVLEALEAQAAASPPGVFDRMLAAQCLAHLGRRREAVAIVQGALRESPRNPEILYLASLVYALAGERTSALVNAQGALEQGVRPRWFSIHPLQHDPELREMLRSRDPD